MKTLFLIAVFFISSISYSQTNYSTIIAGFYNLENLYDTIFHGSYDDVSFTPNGSKAYTKRLFEDKVEKLSKVISEIGTSVNTDGLALLGVSEVENKYVLNALVRHPSIAKRNYQYVHYDSKDFRGVDVALLYNPKYFKVIKSKPIFVAIPVGTKEAMYTRDILWVKGWLDGEAVHIFVNHWPSRSGGEKRSEPARMAAALTVRKFIDSLLIIEPQSKIIVMGDLNDDPINNSITKGLRAIGDIQKVSSDDLFNPWLKMYKRGQGTLAYRDAWSLFDQILISASFLNKKQSGLFYYQNHIFQADFLIENSGSYKGYPMRTYNGDVFRGGYSDHFPTYIVLLKKAL